MSFMCHKTGCVGELPDRTFVYGDLFQDQYGQMMFHIVDEGTPARKVKHLDIQTWDHWFGRGNSSGDRPSFMLLANGQAQYLGYEGIPHSIGV